MKTNQDPAWQAKLAGIAKTKKEGDILTHEEINEIFGLNEPTFDAQIMKANQYSKLLQQYQFTRFTLVEQLKNDLLLCNQIYLDSVFGEGYRIVPANEQTEVAYKKATRNIHQEFEDGKQVMQNVRQAALNAEEKAKSMDLQAKFALLQSMFENNR